MSFEVPILLLTFNRPEKTYKVFERIRQIQPSVLLVSSDGPRDNYAEDFSKCNAVREIFRNIDWDCDLITSYSSSNVGSYRKNSSSLNWAFETVDEVIVLEDDCLPDLSFFYFCQNLLKKYRNDPRVMLISGNNFHFGYNDTNDSYFFSRYIHTWGWAAWKRTWKAVDLKMKRWLEFRDENGLDSLLASRESIRYWRWVFDSMYFGRRRPSWDYQLQLAIFMEGALSITPSVNLVRNIGFDAEAVHHKNSSSIFSNIPEKNMRFPLRHPGFIVPNYRNDKFFGTFKFSLRKRFYRKVSSFFNMGFKDL